MSKWLFPMVALVALVTAARAEETYFVAPVAQLRITEGQIPPLPSSDNVRWWEMGAALRPYVRLDGAGEAYCEFPSLTPDRGEARKGPERLVIRAEAGRDVTGRLYLPKTDASGMVCVRFSVAAGQANEKGREAFQRTKLEYYERMADENLPGAAWFRHRMMEAEKQLDAAAGAQPRFVRADQVEETFALFTGGRAVAENLQLDKGLQVVGQPKGEPGVEVKSLTGIGVAPIDWKPLTKDLKPKLDALASLIPSDQHAVFFPSADTMLTLLERVEAGSTPLLRWLGEDADIAARYQRQLCLPTAALRRIGKLTKSVAITGSDLYLRSGTDVAVVFEVADAAKLEEALHELARATGADAKAMDGAVGGVAYKAVVSPDRSICAYRVVLGNVAIVSNSLQQIGRLVQLKTGTGPSLAAEPEYVYFRDRYAPGEEETAFVMLTDAAIRRWCSPRWRIGDSRRTRAAASLAGLQAAHLDATVKGIGGYAEHWQDLGVVEVNARGASSSRFGTLAFMTPIVELNVEKAWPEEVEAYNRWREAYERSWRQVFDPIAARVVVREGKVAVDLSVMPLTAQSQYQQIADLVRGESIARGGNDPHDALVHLAVSLNKKSRLMQQFSNTMQVLGQNVKIDPLGWVGRSASLYADADPFWTELAAAKSSSEFLEANVRRLPVALQVEVGNPLKLAAFLAAARAVIDMSGPGLTVWEVKQHEGQPYVKVAPAPHVAAASKPLEELAVYYAAMPASLVITLNEPMLKRAMDRSAGRVKPGATTRPWLGEHVSLQVQGAFAGVVTTVLGETSRGAMQRQSWANLPILNEWKLRYPQEDPVALHERVWGVRVACPGGGTYAWNEKWQTMESSVYGHPGEMKKGPEVPAILKQFKRLDSGLQFEGSGLRAKVVLER